MGVLFHSDDEGGGETNVGIVRRDGRVTTESRDSEVKAASPSIFAPGVGRTRNSLELALLRYSGGGKSSSPSMAQTRSLVDDHRHRVLTISLEEPISDSRRPTLSSSIFIMTEAKDYSSTGLEVGCLEEKLHGSPKPVFSSYNY